MTSHSEGKFQANNDEKEQSTLLSPKFIAEKEPLPPKERSVFRVAAPQVIAAVGFGFMVASVAAICVVPTIVIGSLHNVTDAEFELSEYEVSWYGSLSYLVQPIASICSGFTQNVFGRRRMMLAATIPLFVGWIALRFAGNVATLYVTQIIFGLSIGFMEAPSMSYLGEAMQPRFRGTLSSLAEFLYIVGTLYLFLCGSLFSWRAVSLLGAVLPCITFSILVMLPESPTWFIVKGRIDEAEEALRWLRGWVSSEEVQEEMRLLTKVVTENPFSGAKIIANLLPELIGSALEFMKSPGTAEYLWRSVCFYKYKWLHELWLQLYVIVYSLIASSFTEINGEFSRVKNTPNQIALFKEKRVWKPVLLVCLFFLAGNAGSLIGMRPLFMEIFKDMKLSPLLLVWSSVMNGIGCVVCVLTVHKTGKRFISIGSLLMLTISCFALGVYVAAGLTIPWLATSIFVINFFAAGAGILTMPWALVSESFALEARGLSAGVCAAGAYVSYFLFTKTFIALRDCLSMSGVFVLYGAVSLAGAAHLYAFMPETEGKTLKEIEEAFQK